MAKGKKKEKKGKSKKEAVSSEADPNVYFGAGEFTLPNGDSYVGDYCAHRYGLIWREGRGIYSTADGQTYEGEWKDDKLVDQKETIISYPSGEQYRGLILQDKYGGAGMYTMENKMDISCEFKDNKPMGNVMLIDINDRVWQGQAGQDKTVLLPENQFYMNIPEDGGKGKLKEKYLKAEESKLLEEVEISQEKIEPTDRQLEERFFAKSTKTENGIDFTDSVWCQRYLRYRTMKDEISEKLKEEEDKQLTHEEHNWQKKLQKHRLERREKKNQKKLTDTKASVVDTSLIAAFYSSKFKDSCPPIKVFHPSCDWVEKYLQDIEVADEESEQPRLEEQPEKEIEVIKPAEESKKK